MQLPDIIPTELLKEIYTDLAKPGVQNVGKAIGEIIGLGNTILLPLQLLNDKSNLIARNNLERFRLKVEELNASEVQAVVPEIGVPILEKLLYVENEEIANLYINILASASMKDFDGCTHPSFINIVSQLTPDEALIVKYLATTRQVIGYQNLVAGGSGKSYERLQKAASFPVELEITYPEKSTLYCKNLQALGLLSSKDQPLINKAHYKNIDPITDKIISEWKSKTPEVKFSKKNGSYRLTDVGIEFVIACGYNSEEIKSKLKRFWNEEAFIDNG